MSSSKNSKGDLPPPSYDQVTAIDIESGTAPLLCETFSGSIFGTSTIVKYGLSSESYPSHEQFNGLITKAADYNFVVRDSLECVQAEVKVANLRQDLHTTIHDVRGNEIFSLSKDLDLNFIEPIANPPNAMRRFISKISNEKKKNTVHTFQVCANGTRIGLVSYGDQEPTESCLKIYVGIGATGFTVKSFSVGEFIIFRDQSSEVPLCNIKIDPYKYNGKMIFHPETGITTEEQILCTASAFAYQTCWTQLDIKQSNEIAFRMGFWMLFAFGMSMFIFYFGVFLIRL